MKTKIWNRTRAARIWIPNGETVHSVWNDLLSEVDGLAMREVDSRSFRVDFPTKEVPDKLLR